jgi:hypothetical protein
MMADAFIRRQLLHAVSPYRDLYFPYGRIAFLRSMLRWHREAVSGVRYPASVPHPFTIILQSYKRPWNIEPMVRMFLRFECIEQVIVSNNNPDVVLRLPLTDGRLKVINQSHQYPASMFALLARDAAQDDARFFLAVDDDLFLFPHQLAALMQSLLQDPSIPHGVVGQIRTDTGEWLHHRTGDRVVDVLNRAYAFTADHIYRYMQILDRLGYSSDEAKAQLPFGSDMILSKSGKDRPRIHDVGRLLSCPTNAKPGIARFKDAGFSAFREKLWSELAAQ